MVAASREGMGLGIIPRDFMLSDVASDLQMISIGSGSLYNNLYLVQEANYINNTLGKKFLLELSNELKAKLK